MIEHGLELEPEDRQRLPTFLPIAHALVQGLAGLERELHHDRA
jgi:hypothetical protein